MLTYYAHTQSLFQQNGISYFFLLSIIKFLVNILAVFSPEMQLYTADNPISRTLIFSSVIIVPWLFTLKAKKKKTRTIRKHLTH